MSKFARLFLHSHKTLTLKSFSKPKLTTHDTSLALIREIIFLPIRFFPH